MRRFAYTFVLDLPTLIPYATAVAFLAVAAGLGLVAALVVSAVGEQRGWTASVVVLRHAVARVVDVRRYWVPRSRAATEAEEHGLCDRRARKLRIVSPRRLTPASA